MAECNYWMIGADGGSYGPADLATMLRWIDEQRIAPDTQVSLSANGPWQNAGEMPEFAAALGQSAPTEHLYDGATAGAPPTTPQVLLTAMPSDWPPSNLQVVLLISGILNILTGVSSIAGFAVAGIATFGLTWCCCPIGVLMLVVGVMECIDYSTAARTEPRRYLERAQMWGIINILTLLGGGILTPVCGLLQVIWVGEARRKYLG